jgi:hypothetical protein
MKAYVVIEKLHGASETSVWARYHNSACTHNLHYISYYLVLSYKYNNCNDNNPIFLKLLSLPFLQNINSYRNPHRTARIFR